MINSPSSIVLIGSNRNKVGTMVRGMYRSRWLKKMSARIGAWVSKITFLSKGVALPFSMCWILGSLGPLSTLISAKGGLEIVGVLNHLALRGRESLSS
jgi:hypothetical protein